MLSLADIFGFSDTTFYWALAIGGTSLFVIKLLLSLIGGALGSDMDFDTDAADAVDALDGADGVDIEHASGAAFTIVSLQSILAFFGAMGWAGLACSQEWNLSPLWTMIVSFGFGFAVMMLNAALMYFARRLNAQGKVDLHTAVGHIGRVYLNIPAAGEGAGQVEVNASGVRKIVPAISNGPALDSFTQVKILELRDKQVLVVAPLETGSVKPSNKESTDNQSNQ